MDFLQYLRTFARTYWPVIFFLIAGVTACFSLYFGNFFRGQWDTDLTSNLGSELIGAIIGFTLINGAIALHQKKVTERKDHRTLTALRRPLDEHLKLLYHIRSAVGDVVNHSEEHGHGIERFIQTVADNFNLLDFNKSVKTRSRKKWGEHLAHEAHYFFDALGAYLEKYGGSISSEKLLFSLEEIYNHPFLCSLTQLKYEDGDLNEAYKDLVVHNMGGMDNLDEHIEEYGRRLSLLLAYVNRELEPERHIRIVPTWTLSAPQIGSGRIS
ncbi:hypothetical protein FUAX_07920 [Fulvitalea axinellae]|uniref:Phage abortive infection protein n=1 Tax=Fulvitalea axinellae TaxID=1182444 RepID=A0AAU9CGL0_9BACT|nr:hypothetical protein FUAX_07920 [Fulvitalea axinellae]